MSIARSTTAFAAALFLSTLTGCGGDTHESLADELTAKMKEITAELKQVKDLASAKAASPKLKAINEDIKSIRTRMDKSFGDAFGELLTEGMRIQGLGPDVAKELDASMDAMKGM